MLTIRPTGRSQDVNRQAWGGSNLVWGLCVFHLLLANSGEEPCLHFSVCYWGCVTSQWTAKTNLRMTFSNTTRQSSIIETRSHNASSHLRLLRLDSALNVSAFWMPDGFTLATPHQLRRLFFVNTSEDKLNFHSTPFSFVDTFNVL
jgi:hypothetical protein